MDCSIDRGSDSKRWGKVEPVIGSLRYSQPNLEDNGRAAAHLNQVDEGLGGEANITAIVGEGNENCFNDVVDACFARPDNHRNRDLPIGG